MLSFIFLVVGVLAQQTFAEEAEAIVGGQPAVPVEFPYQVSIKHNGYHLCGGSIIGPTKILTAAHCVYGTAHTDLKIVSGTIDVFKGQLHEVKSIRVHLEYADEWDGDVRRWVNDIAVITLSEPIEYDRFRAPIALTETKPVNGQQCTLAGWGMTQKNGRRTQFLRKMNQVVMSLEECQNRRPNKRLTERHLCAYNRYGIGACVGDSGGPLVSNGKQIGILSWTTLCAVGLPDVYVDVYHYRNFIQSS